MILISWFKTFAQGTDMSNVKRQSLFIGISLKPSQTHIINDGTSSVSKMLSSTRSSVSGSVEFGYFFSRYFGLSSEIGLNSYSTELTLDTYQGNFSATDSENEAYEKRVTVSGIKELQKVSYIGIPLYANLRLPLNEKIGFFLQTGVNMEIPINKSYTSSGSFTYKGYYSTYNVLLENLPAFGFPSNLNSNAKGELEVKSMEFNFIANAGLDYYLLNKVQVALAAGFERSLSNISGFSSPDKFQLSTDPNKINSLMGGSTKTIISSFGLKISFRYYLK